MVLAGGLGTRLRPVVADVPKPMAPVAGRPFLEILLEALALGGVTRVVLSVGHLRDTIVSHFGRRFAGMDLSCSEEETPLGTGGAIRRALGRVEGERLLVVNGDTFLELDHGDLWRRHEIAREGDPELSLTIAVHPMDDASRYGSVRIEAGRVVGFDAAGAAGPGWINAGVYVMERSLLDDCALDDPFSFERDYLAPRVARLRPLAYEARGRFVDIGVPADYERAQELLG